LFVCLFVVYLLDERVVLQLFPGLHESHYGRLDVELSVFRHTVNSTIDILGGNHTQTTPINLTLKWWYNYFLRL